MSERVVQTSSMADSRRFRIVGAAHLGLAAGINITTGLALLYLGATNQLVRLAFTDLDTYVSPQILVRDANLVAGVATTGALVAGVILVVLGVVTLLVVHRVIHDRRPTWWRAGSVASAVNPLATPLAGIAIVLLWIGRQLRDEDRLSSALRGPLVNADHSSSYSDGEP